MRRLFAQELPEGTEFTVFLVDDGCTDGTGGAVKREFPSVNVILGDGTLYWNQGMRLAWKCAYLAGDWDAYLWLNDDSMLLDNALATMIETLYQQERETGRRGIVVGSCREPVVGGQGSEVGDQFSEARSVEDGAWSEEHGAGSMEQGANKQAAPLPPAPCSLPPAKLTYGGRDERGLVEPTDVPQPVKAFNGNLVLVSRDAFQELGNLNPAYSHSFGDIDYGIRANNIGIIIWLAPYCLSECERNPPAKWRNPEIPLPERWRAFCGPKGLKIDELKVFAKIRNYKWWIPSYIKQCYQVLFPKKLDDL